MFTDIALPQPSSPSNWEIFTKEKSAMTFLKNPKLKTRLSGALFGYNEVFCTRGSVWTLFTQIAKQSEVLRIQIPVKSQFFSGSPNFGDVSPFLVNATNTFSELIHPLLKLPNCTLKFYNLFEALTSFGLLPLRYDIILHFTIYTTFYTEATLKAALELLDTSSRLEAKCRQ